MAAVRLSGPGQASLAPIATPISASSPEGALSVLYRDTGVGIALNSAVKLSERRHGARPVVTTYASMGTSAPELTHVARRAGVAPQKGPFVTKRAEAAEVTEVSFYGKRLRRLTDGGTARQV